MEKEKTIENEFKKKFIVHQIRKFLYFRETNNNSIVIMKF